MNEPDTSDSTPIITVPQETESAQHEGPFVNYLARRETHTSRALISIFTALCLIAVLIYMAAEIILSMTGHTELLIRPWYGAEFLSKLGAFIATRIPASVVATGITIIFAGLILVFKALAPGMLKRHIMHSKRMAIVIDDAVIAAAVSQLVRQEEQLEQDQVITTVTRRRITPHITPTSGRLISSEKLEENLRNQIDDWQLKPVSSVHINLNSEGIVGR